jgi:Tol biopolymer transport system component
MASPNFLIIGAQKSGSSWLARHLRNHPDVFMPRGEIHFFDKKFNFARGREWYESHFSGATTERAIGEKTPDYLWANGLGAEGHLPHVHHNLHSYYPTARLIVVMRNPVLRAVSAVHHMIRTGRCSPLLSIDDLLVGNKRHLFEPHGVIQKGRYYEQVQAYLELFPRDQFLFLLFEEDVVKRPHETLAQVCRFLGIDPGFHFGTVNQAINEFNRSMAGLAVTYYFKKAEPLGRFLDRHLPQEKKKPKFETLARLHELYAEENEKLFKLLGRRSEAWAAPDRPVPVRRPAPVGTAKRGLWGLQGNRLAATAAVLALVLIPASFWAARRSSSADAVSEAAMVMGSQRKAARLIATRAVEESPALSPDGRRLAYVGDADGHKQVFVRTLGKGADRAVSQDSADELQPTWSTDGQHVAFVRAAGTGPHGSDVGDSAGNIRKGDIWAVDLASGEERKLVDDAFAPAYSPDGAQLAFDASRDGSQRIWVASADGENAHRVSDAAGTDVADLDPEWSPDGSKLVFRRTAQNQTDLVVLNLATGATVKLTDDDALDTDAVWSPSGRQVYFSSSRAGSLDLWRIEVDSGGRPTGPPERLTTGAGDEMEPVVAPDGRRVIFAVRDQAPASADPSPSDRWASFRSTRHGGDIWVMDGI